jgi:peroxiredoxin
MECSAPDAGLNAGSSREGPAAVAGVGLGIAAAFVIVLLLAYGALLQQMLRQQGRLLTRVDDLERRLAGSFPGSTQNGHPPGLAVGASFPPFQLPDFTGDMHGLDDLAGKRALLVHWNPSCGFCEQIAPDLAALQNALRKRDVELVLASYGDVESNRRLASDHDLECRVLLLDGSLELEPFKGLGTPAAYLLDERGRVAEPLALGAVDVPALAHAAAGARKHLSSERSLAESKLVREGLEPGTPAPLFSLPDLSGETISLADFRGRRVLLVFSDPNCGPCDAVADDLAALDRERDDIAIVAVSRGELEENRRKADEHAVDFPVVIQNGWRVSKQYGIFATPVAFLIDENGVIATNVAKGRDEILELAEAGALAPV